MKNRFDDERCSFLNEADCEEDLDEIGIEDESSEEFNEFD